MMRLSAGSARRRHGEVDELVSDILVAEQRPLSAYDIAARASEKSGRIVPAQIYRTLARLVRQRRAMRIEMLGAYVACTEVSNLCLVCLDCRGVQMIHDDAIRSVAEGAAARRFHLAAAPMEAAGLCYSCMDRRQDPLTGGV